MSEEMKKLGDVLISSDPLQTLEHTAQMMRLLAAVEPQHLSEDAAVAYANLAGHCAVACETARDQIGQSQHQSAAA